MVVGIEMRATEGNMDRVCIMYDITGVQQELAKYKDLGHKNIAHYTV